MKKISVLLALFVLLQCFFLVACNKKDEEEGTPATTPEVTTPETTTSDEPPVEPEVYAEVLIADLSKYNLICAQRAPSNVTGQFWQLQSQIQKMCGTAPLAESDYYEESEFEILIGSTNREESQTFLADLLWDDYGYAIVGNKIVIAGHTNAGTFQAIKLFLQHIKSGDHTTVFFSNKDQYLYRYPYVSDTFLLNGIDVLSAKIVVNGGADDQRLAQALSDKSLELCGRRPEIVTDETLILKSDPLIIIGASKHVPLDMKAEWDAAQQTVEGQFSYYVGNGENIVWINAAVLEGYSAIKKNILPQIQSNETATLTIETGLFKVPQLFSVMSFNVYVGNQFNKAYIDRVIATILDNTPSVLGVQEASVPWMTALKSGLGDIYTSVGVGRDWGGLGEHSAIFYRTDMFNLIESGTKWLSNTPDQEGTKLTNANFPRIMTYAILERKTDGARFLYVNTHLDHNGNNSVEVAENVRQAQIEILIAEIAKLGDLPTIVTGDFNVTPDASAYTTMITNGYLDASHVAAEGEILPTYNGMSDSDIDVLIDYIFVSPELADAVDTYTVCPAKRDGQWISDHNAIIATITLPVEKAE
ncbi:MAG: endonuclease/exonuclease/phosphatase family protein [Ruminococcaceae bacterium]|nr:endonuclease/exonuclease/phosphatase family protein [Oscillospiraceae bacterium]